MKGSCRVKSNKNEEVYIQNFTMKQKLIDRLMGITEIEPNKSLTCCYRLRIDLMIDDGLDTSEESINCMNCNGLPKSCFSYCSIDHILDYYRTMRGEVR